jgi:hypothetical protein
LPTIKKAAQWFKQNKKTFWIDGLNSWDSKFEGKNIAVWGDVVQRDDNPVFLDTGKIVSQGIPVHFRRRDAQPAKQILDYQCPL